MILKFTYFYSLKDVQIDILILKKKLILYFFLNRTRLILLITKQLENSWKTISIPIIHNHTVLAMNSWVKYNLFYSCVLRIIYYFLMICFLYLRNYKSIHIMFIHTKYRATVKLNRFTCVELTTRYLLLFQTRGKYICL